jgi:Thrombospondin type 3 repeat
VECGGAGDCLGGSACEDGVCDHSDPDDDGVGSECDTCPFTPNPGQVIDGMMQDDDGDGDFVGDACEHPSCVTRDDPRTLAFYDVAVGGLCCATRWQGRPLVDPDGNPLDLGDLPELEPGLVELPPGCEEALAAAGVDEATALSPADVGGLDALGAYLCLLPPWDQDFDGLGDACDLCPFAFDPTNAPYVSPEGMVFPNDGAYCNGEYSCEAAG